jgi:hypothetical protein
MLWDGAVIGELDGFRMIHLMSKVKLEMRFLLRPYSSHLLTYRASPLTFVHRSPSLCLTISPTDADTLPQRLRYSWGRNVVSSHPASTEDLP